MPGFYWIGVWHPKTEHNIGTLWRSAWNFGAAGIFTIGRRYKRQASDTVGAWAHIPLMEFDTVDDLRRGLPYSCPLVGVELTDQATDVEDFDHPDRACYLLGAEDHGLSPAVLENCHKVIQLPGRQCLNVAVAGSIAMYDRVTKTRNLTVRAP